MDQPPLKQLHPESSLSRPKLILYAKLTNEEIIESLKSGQLGSLKARRDGTIIDGHHRIKVLQDRGIGVDSLPRELVEN
jgi:ParB-like chromosome segregation protein Spo0J